MSTGRVAPSAVVPRADAGTITPARIEAELTRRPLVRLPFPPAIEARYEAETKAARAWNIRLTVPVGLTAYIAFGLTDAQVLPDLGWGPTLCRFGLVTPVALFAMWMCTRFGAAFRESFISVGITGTMMIPVGFIALSRAPLAPYTMLVVLLVSMFGNIVMRLRFHWACAFTVMTVSSVGLMLDLKPDLPPGIGSHIAIATLTGVTFGIVANNQLERAERRSFLLALRETLRAAELSVEKATFSALSLVDPLTGLANRRAFDARLAELWRARQAGDRPFALLMIDVDHFKRYNDHYGHPAGDLCLDRVAQAIQKAVGRSQDLVARYGGEEFAVLLVDCLCGDGIRIAERLRHAVQDAAIAHGDRGDGDYVVTVSVGVASSDKDAADPDDAASDAVNSDAVNSDAVNSAAGLIALADRHLYAAKHAGRNRVFPKRAPL